MKHQKYVSRALLLTILAAGALAAATAAATPAVPDVIDAIDEAALAQSGGTSVTRRTSTPRVRGHSPRRHHRHVSVHVGYRYYTPRFYGGLYFPYYYGAHHHYYPPYHYRDYPGPWGALDLNVKPKKTQVFVDGEYVGKAGQYDGFPGYLWLPRGTYELILYKEGFETEVREVRLIPGGVIDFRVDMRPGEATDPTELRAARQAERPPRRPVAAPASGAASDGGDDRDVRAEPARLKLAIAPDDASVYLDGRFLGTGGELARLHAGLLVDPGRHELEVIRPGFAEETLEFSVEEGEEREIVVELASG